MADFETLLGPSGILLYGRVLADLTITHQVPPTTIPTGPADDGAPPRLGSNRLLQDQLADGDANFARIYGFSYEGHYFDLARPTIFLVHGEGTDAEGPRPPAASNRVSRAPAHVDRSGVAAQEHSFAEDIKVWSYDRGDFSIRMDVETGMFDDILLEAELNEDMDEAFYSGTRTRVSGTRTRVSGTRTRVSGTRTRSRGGNSD
jgi:hypothetical protein